MLIAFFTVTNDEDCQPITPDGFAGMITTIAQQAWTDASRALRSQAPYDVDGGTPFGQVYVTDFRSDGALGSARQICEPWSPGEGICVGLVFEGKASGPMYYTPATPVGVLPEDIDRPVPEMFARHLDVGMRFASPRLEVSHEYHVSDWSLYERSSALMHWTY